MNIKKLGGKHIKIENRKLVFSHIFNQPGISRPEIVNLTELSAASVGRIADELLEEGLIREYDTDARNVGRRPTLLSVCGEKIPSLALELDRDKVVCAIVDMAGKVYYRNESYVNSMAHNPLKMCVFMRDMINEAMSQPCIQDKKVAGIGVVLPGLIDMDSGMVLLSSQLHWHNVPLGAMLGDVFPDMMIIIDNEMNARALAESLYGELNREQNAVVLGIGSGVGAGIITNGRIYRGSHNMAGEVGHIIMDPSGKMCECGFYGCLQTYVADWALLEDARRFKCDASIKDIISAADSGEQWAISIIDRFIRYTKTAISYFTNLLNPSAVVLSGQLLEDHPSLAERLIDDYQLHINEHYNTPYRLSMSGLGRDGAIIGAATLLLQKVYDRYI